MAQQDTGLRGPSHKMGEKPHAVKLSVSSRQATRALGIVVALSAIGLTQ